MHEWPTTSALGRVDGGAKEAGREVLKTSTSLYGERGGSTGRQKDAGGLRGGLVMQSKTSLEDT